MTLKIPFGFSLYLLLMFPPMLPFLGSTEISKQASLILLLVVGGVLLSYRRRVKIDFVFLVLLFYALYCFLSTVVKQGFIGGSLLINDLFESTRVMFIALFYLYGFNLIRYRQFNFFDNVQHWKIFLVFSALVVVSFILKDGYLGLLSSFYNSKEHRFSGLMPGINYIWFPLVVLIGFGIAIYQRRRLSKAWLVLVSLVVLASLVLSASFTSIICVFGFVFLFLALVYFQKHGVRSFLIIGPVLLVSLSIGYAFLSYLLENSIGFSGKFQLILAFIESGELSEFSSLSKRFNVWANAFQLIEEKPLTGYGANKSGLRYTDNTYVMTLYRYGILGLLLESSIYLGLIFFFLKSCFVHKKNVLLSAFCLSMIAAYLVSGLTANSFYELKLPYVFFAVVGMLKYMCQTKSDYVHC